MCSFFRSHSLYFDSRSHVCYKYSTLTSISAGMSLKYDFMWLCRCSSENIPVALLPVDDVQAFWSPITNCGGFGRHFPPNFFFLIKGLAWIDTSMVMVCWRQKCFGSGKMQPRSFHNGRTVYLCVCVHNTSSYPCGSCCCGGWSGRSFKYLLQKILFSVGARQRFQLFLGHFHLSNPVGDKPDTSAPNCPCVLVGINKIKLNGLVPRGEQAIWLAEG